MVYEILFLAPFPPHTGGISYYSTQFFKEAPEFFKINSIGFKRVFPKIFYPGSSLNKLENELNIPLKIDILNPFTWNCLSKLKLAKSGFFLLPYWTSTLALPFYFISKSFKKKYPDWKFILWCHNVKDHKPIFFFEIFKNYLFRNSDGLIVHSRFAFKEVEKFKKPVLLSFLPLHKIPYNLIEKEIAREKLKIGRDDKIILFLGTIRKYKGVENLIEIGRILKERNFKFIVAGDLWRECKKYIKDFEELGFKTYFGFHPWEEIINFLSSTDLLILPYKNASGSGILMMAYYYNIPFCIPNIKEIQDYLPQNYPVLKNPNEMAEFIINFFKNEEMRESLIEKIKRKQKEFAWGNFFERFSKFIEQEI